MMTEQLPAQPPTPMWRRLLPLGLLVACVVLFFASGLGGFITFDEIARRYGELSDWVARQPLLVFFLAVAGYAFATAISLPAGWLLTVTAGLILGWVIGTVAVVLGATLGACLLYVVARYALADFFRARSGKVLNRMAEGFREDSMSYLFFLRLAPVFPFALVNVVPAILGVPFRIYFLTTLFGIIPGTLAYAFAGEGLRSIVADRAAACAAGVPPCGDAISARDLVTPQILIAFGLLSLVALLPVILKRMRKAK